MNNNLKLISDIISNKIKKLPLIVRIHFFIKRKIIRIKFFLKSFMRKYFYKNLIKLVINIFIIPKASKYWQQQKCLQCGICCQAIYLSLSHNDFSKKMLDIINIAKTDYNLNFVLKNFIPISNKEAFKINPLLKWVMFLLEYKEQHFFKCNKFDEKNNKCSVYDNRPSFCKDFPYRKGSQIYSRKCAYHLRRIA